MPTCRCLRLHHQIGPIFECERLKDQNERIHDTQEARLPRL